MPSFDEACATLGARLRTRFAEVEASLANLIDEPGPDEAADPLYLDYLDSLRATRPAVLAYAVEVIEFGERRAPEVPAAVLAAARLAARAGVPLDAVLRRYSAGRAPPRSGAANTSGSCWPAVSPAERWSWATTSTATTSP